MKVLIYLVLLNAAIERDNPTWGVETEYICHSRLWKLFGNCKARFLAGFRTQIVAFKSFQAVVVHYRLFRRKFATSFALHVQTMHALLPGMPKESGDLLTWPCPTHPWTTGCSFAPANSKCSGGIVARCGKILARHFQHQPACHRKQFKHWINTCK